MLGVPKIGASKMAQCTKPNILGLITGTHMTGENWLLSRCELWLSASPQINKNVTNIGVEEAGEVIGVKSGCCFAREPKFSFQHRGRKLTTVSNSSSRGSDTLLVSKGT